eukprot:Sspe_Gene.97351::Locus_70960_Transcript_2_2_Confidence_0.667_Length_1366::g.97351::m.97351/K10436/MAPRE; microtubule-associated protein, RP/EB family
MQRVKQTNDLLVWVGTILETPEIPSLDRLRSGAELVQIFHMLYPTFSLARVNFQAETKQHYEQNFKILQQVFHRNGVVKEFDIANILDHRKTDMFYFLTWTRVHFMDRVSRIPVGYNPRLEREHAIEVRRARLSRRIEDSSASESAGSLSSVSGRSSSTNYLSSYNRRRAETWGLEKPRRPGSRPLPPRSLQRLVAAAVAILVSAKAQPASLPSPPRKQPPSPRPRTRVSRRKVPTTQPLRMGKGDVVDCYHLFSDDFDFLCPRSWCGNDIKDVRSRVEAWERETASPAVRETASPAVDASAASGAVSRGAANLSESSSSGTLSSIQRGLASLPLFTRAKLEELFEEEEEPTTPPRDLRGVSQAADEELSL